MYIKCTNGTAIVDMLYHLPPLPLLVDYRCTIGVPITEQDESGIYHTLQLRDRVLRIILHLPPSILHKCVAFMDGRFPILEHLSLWSVEGGITTATLPRAFLAPNIRFLETRGVGLPPKRLRLLTSTVSLVTLALWDVQISSYFRPRLVVARLSSLSQLEELFIGFSDVISRSGTERELLGGHGTPVTLPNLKFLQFRGFSAYLESLAAQIRAPVLGELDVALFNQTAFVLPHLSHLINTTERFKLPSAKVFFSRDVVFIVTLNNCSLGPFRLCVLCTRLNRQIDRAAQICSALAPALSGVEQFVLDFHKKVLPTEWQNSEIDSTTWHELLRPFIRMKELHIQNGLLKEVSRALQVDEVGSDPGFLPHLQQIFAEDNLFASFIDTRRVMGLPIQFMGPTSPAFPKLKLASAVT
jgi:hypothetical protein